MIPTWGTSTGRNSAGGIPSLLLDFSNQSYLLNGTAFAAFGGSPNITFSRGTNATLIDSTGQLTFAPSNLLLNSESFGVTTSWGRTNIDTVNVNASIAPNGTTTADKVIPNTTSGSHIVDESIGTVQSGNIYTFSVYAKADGYNFIRLNFGNVAGGGYTFFDVLNGNIGGTGSTISNAIENVGNGWFRCSVVRAASSTAILSGDIYVQSANNQFAGWAGNGTDGVLVWGAQIEAVTYETAPSVYNSTTPKNLLGFTEEFNNAAWVKTLATVTPNSIADPNGNLNADTLSATLGNATILQNISLLAAPYTFSIWLKRKTGTGNINITINGVTFITQAVTADWARFRTTLTPSAGTKNIGVQIVTLGDEVYAWGAQVSDSASLDPYVYNPAAALTSTAYYGPRFDYSPTTLAPLGLLIEETRTNLSLQSQTLDVSPWVLVNATIVSNVISAPDGTLTADFLKEDLTVTATTHNIDQFVPTTSTLYTTSIYAKAGTRSKILFAGGGFSGQGFGAIFDLINGTMFSNVGNKGKIINAGNGWYKCIITFTTSNTNIFNWYMCDSSNTNNYIGDGTSGLYLWGAQTEAAGFATSYIPTAGSSVTRSADVATMVGNNFTNWYNQTAGTLTVEFDASANGSATYVSASNGTITQNSVHVDNEAGNMRAAYYSGSTEVASLVLGAIGTIGATNKIATAYTVNDFAASRNGETVVTDTGGAVPVGLTQLNIGVDDRLTAAFYTSNHIKAISYFNSQLTNAQLQALTA